MDTIGIIIGNRTEPIIVFVFIDGGFLFPFDHLRLVESLHFFDVVTSPGYLLVPFILSFIPP